MHRDSAHLGNSSLPAEKVDVLLMGAVPAFAKHLDRPELTQQIMAASRDRRAE